MYFDLRIYGVYIAYGGVIVTIKEASDLVEGKKCTKCGTVLTAENVGWTGDKYGWKLNDSHFLMTAIIYCPNTSCGKQFGMAQLGISKPENLPKHVM